MFDVHKCFWLLEALTVHKVEILFVRTFEVFLAPCPSWRTSHLGAPFCRPRRLEWAEVLRRSKGHLYKSIKFEWRKSTSFFPRPLDPFGTNHTFEK